MAKIIVFHFIEAERVPKLTERELKDLREKFDEELKNYPGVFFTTYLDENGMGICDWEAPDTETVKEIEKKVLGSPPADPVILVRKVL